MTYPEGTLVRGFSNGQARWWGVVASTDTFGYREDSVWCVWRDTEEEALEAFESLTPDMTRPKGSRGSLTYIVEDNVEFVRHISSSKTKATGRGSFLSFQRKLNEEYYLKVEP